MPPTESPAVPQAADRARLAGWFDRTRARSKTLFDLVSPAAFLSRPILLRHPIVFYEGHLPVFAFNTIVRKALGQPGIDAAFETLFARGIDPENEADAARRGVATWPTRAAIAEYAVQADRRIREAIESADIDRPGHPLLDKAQAVYASIEHELMHQETLLYIFHRLPFEQKIGPVTGSETVRPSTSSGRTEGPSTSSGRTEGSSTSSGRTERGRTVSIPDGCATLGARRADLLFGWDNEFERVEARVPAFDIDVHNVTNREYLEFVAAGGYDAREFWDADAWQWRTEHGVRHPLFWEQHDGAWYWRGMFELIPLPPDWPVYVSHAEASAFARWRGRRLPTEAEYHRAAFGTPSGEERAFPWGDDEPDPARHGNFDFVRWDPVDVGSYPEGRSAWGVHDLVGNGWEWTSTVFAPFPGFAPLPSYPEYSADFFDGQHFVMKGASPATGRELVRRSFRNWFRPLYPYVYATFRTVG